MQVTKTTQTRVEPKEVAKALAKYVAPIAATMGPGGRNIMLVNKGQRNLGKDGATVGAFSHYSDTPIEDLASTLAREAQYHQQEKVGDGTSTTAFLLDVVYRALAESGLDRFEVNAQLPVLKNRIREVWADLTEEVPLTQEALFDLAMVATHGDEEMAAVVAEAQLKAGRRGFIYGQSPHEAYADQDQVFATDGVVLPTGLAIRQLANSEQFAQGLRHGFHVKGRCYWVLGEVPLNDDKGIGQVFRYLDKLDQDADVAEPTPVVFVAPDMDEKGMAKLMANAYQNTRADNHREVGLVLLDHGGKNPRMVQDTIEDLADVINPEGFYFSSRKNRFLHQVHQLAREFDAPVALTTGWVHIHAGDTEIELTDEARERAKRKSEALRTSATQEKQAGNGQLSQALEARAARLVGEFPRILLRKGTESEKTRRHMLLDDAIRTTQSAVREGRVPGQGLALMQLGLRILDDTGGMQNSVGIALTKLRAHVIALMAGEELAEQYEKAVLDMFADSYDDQPLLTKVVLSSGAFVNPVEVGVYDSAAIGLNAVLTALDTAAQLYDTEYVLMTD